MKNIVEAQPHIYIQHSTGVLLRTPPYVRNELRKQTPEGEILVELISNNIFTANRKGGFSLPENREGNSRLLKKAALVSSKLSEIARAQKIPRYCTVMHGSLSLGTTRDESHSDPSDVDVDLIIDSDCTSKDERRQIREEMREFGNTSPHRVDSYVWTIDEVKQNQGQGARIYLASSAMPHINIGDLWSEVQYIGIETTRFLSLPKCARKKTADILLMLENEGFEEAILELSSLRRFADEISTYFKQINIMHHDNPSKTAKMLREILLPKSPTEEEGSKPKSTLERLGGQTVFSYGIFESDK